MKNMGSFTPVSHLNISGQDMTLTVKRKQIPGKNTEANCGVNTQLMVCACMKKKITI